MKRLLSVVGSLLGLLALAALALFLALAFSGSWRGAEPVSQTFQSPIETPTQPPYPLPATPTRPSIPTIPPTVTRAPKPSPSPTPIPTATPVPTPLPLPPSAFYALWTENYPEGEGSVLWLADPRDIGSRKEVLRFEQDAIAEAALSPNGRKLALVTTYWKTSTLWIANADGSGLQRFDQGPGVGGPLFWSRDSRLVTYGVSWREETTAIPTVPGRTGTPVETFIWRGAIELVDIATGEKQRLLEVEADTSLSVLGWSANGQELYYSRSILQETGRQYELWAVDRRGRDAHRVASLGHEPVPLILAPDGSSFLIGTPQGWAWLSADGQTRQDIPMPPWKQRCGLAWSSNGYEVILCQVDEQQPIEYIKVLNLHTETMRVLGSIEIPPRGLPFSPLAISPDMQWMAASVYQGGMYWIHIPTGLTVSVPSQGRRPMFVAWVPRQAAVQVKEEH